MVCRSRLVLDSQARVIDAAGNAETVDATELKRWRGKLWQILVTQESRGKLLALLDAALQLEPLQPNSSPKKAKVNERPIEHRETRLSEAKSSTAQQDALSTWRQLSRSPYATGSLPISYRGEAPARRKAHCLPSVLIDECNGEVAAAVCAIAAAS
jgi:hypothetical protein